MASRSSGRAAAGTSMSADRRGATRRRPSRRRSWRPSRRSTAIYRSLCALIYNYVPMSGHPGGSISSGRFVVGRCSSTRWTTTCPIPDRVRRRHHLLRRRAQGARTVRDVGAAQRGRAHRRRPTCCPRDARQQLRLEDLLGFRRNPTTDDTALPQHFGPSRSTDIPTPATPFVRLSTGASGVGVASSLGLACGAADYYGDDAPRACTSSKARAA